MGDRLREMEPLLRNGSRPPRKKRRKPLSEIKGKGLQIVEFDEISDQCRLNRPALESILLRPELKNMPLVVVSIVGPTSSGKTSLENYCLRFMERTDDPDWLGSDDEPLIGLDWRPTHRTVTRGIWLWNKPYIRRLSNGKQCAVLFMDTEGLYGKDEIRGRWSHVFGISTAASSIQIFNLKEELSPRDMEELQVFVRLAEMGIKSDVTESVKDEIVFKPFQRLWFLIRSWRYHEDYEYGHAGGSKYLADIFKVQETDKKELKEMKESILNAYEEINCYLMPHPSDVIYQSSFRGEVGSLSEEFKINLTTFAECVLSPKHLVPKELIGITLTGERYVDFFCSVINTFNNGNFPKIESLMRAISMATKKQLVDYFVQLYKEMLQCELDLAIEKKPKKRGKLLNVFRIVSDDVISMYEGHPKFITKSEADQLKEKISLQMKVIQETIATDYADKFVRYYEELYLQLMDQLFLQAFKVRAKYIDPQTLINVHGRLILRLLNEVEGLSKYNVNKDIQSKIRRRLNACFLKYQKDNEFVVQENQNEQIKFVAATSGSGIVGITAGSITAHAAAVATTSSAFVSLIGGGLIVFGVASVAAAAYIGYSWYVVKKSSNKAKEQVNDILAANAVMTMNE